MKQLNILVACEYSGAIRQRLRDAGHNAWSCDLLPADDGSTYHYQGDMWDLIEQGRVPNVNGFARDGLGIFRLPDNCFHRTASPASKWDVLIAFPPCTYLTVSGAWLFAERSEIKRNVAEGVLTGADRAAAREEAVTFVRRILTCGIKQVIVENPSRSFLCTAFRRPDYVLHPYQCGDDGSKSTGFWTAGDVTIEALPKSKWFAPRMVERDGKPALPRWGNQTDSGQNAEPPAADRWKTRSNTWPGIADALVKAVLS